MAKMSLMVNFPQRDLLIFYKTAGVFNHSLWRTNSFFQKVIFIKVRSFLCKMPPKLRNLNLDQVIKSTHAQEMMKILKSYFN